MARHMILFEHLGECSDTGKDPVAVVQVPAGDGLGSAWSPRRGHFAFDPAEQVGVIHNHDNWLPVSVDRWAVAEVELPDWLDPGEWLTGWTSRLVWLAGFGADVLGWPEHWVRSLATFTGTPVKLAAMVQLLKTRRFRSRFRASLLWQLRGWLDTEPADRRFDDPFSRKQWAALVRPEQARAAKRLDSDIYHSRRYRALRA